MDRAQQVPVVIGGASGIGTATARLLAESGHDVTAADLGGLVEKAFA